jgi:DNA-binding MarR family transcriptional regulator
VLVENIDPPLIGALLRMPWEIVRQRMLDGLHQRGFTDLVSAHLTVLQYPGPDAQRPSELADRLRISKQALNYLLGQMENLGYLTREADREDQRSRRVKLTARGQAVIQGIREIVAEVETEWETQLGAASFSQLRDLLTRLRAITSTPLPQPPASHQP